MGFYYVGNKYICHFSFLFFLLLCRKYRLILYCTVFGLGTKNVFACCKSWDSEILYYFLTITEPRNMIIFNIYIAK